MDKCECYEESSKLRNKLLTYDKKYWNDSIVLLHQAQSFYKLGKYPQSMDFYVKAKQVDALTNKLDDSMKKDLMLGKAECHSQLG